MADRTRYESSAIHLLDAFPSMFGGFFGAFLKVVLASVLIECVVLCVLLCVMLLNVIVFHSCFYRKEHHALVSPLITGLAIGGSGALVWIEFGVETYSINSIYKSEFISRLGGNIQ